MNSMDEEEQRINEWMKDPVIPQWLNEYNKQPGKPNTLHYDETIDQYVYTTVEGEELFFNGTEEAYDDPRVKRSNTELIGNFPDLNSDRIFGQSTKDNRLLFFGTSNQHYKNFLYKIYLCQNSEENYEENPNNFFASKYFISSHMLNWRVDDAPIRDYWFEVHSHISKIALINGQSHVWKAGTKVVEKPSMTETEHYAVGNTIEQAIIKLAAEIHTTYTWEGNKR